MARKRKMERLSPIRGREIGRLLSEGEWVRGRWIALCYRQGKAGKGCILVGRKLGSAVVRNRVKRRIREIVQKQALWTGTWEIAFCPRPEAGNATYRELERDVLDLLDKAGMRAGV